jgi:hypothetical protein
MRFIHGRFPQLQVKLTPPRAASSTAPNYGWPGGEHFWFRVERGVLKEYNDLDGNHVYARHMPEDVTPALDLLDAEIAALETSLKARRAERQELLHAAAQRGSRIKRNETTITTIKESP